MVRPVGEVSGRVQDEEPDHQRNEEQGVKDQPCDRHGHHFGETFFPALVWTLEKGYMDSPVLENVLISLHLAVAVVGEEEEGDKACDTIDKQVDEREVFNREQGNKDGGAPNIEGKL